MSSIAAHDVLSRLNRPLSESQLWSVLGQSLVALQRLSDAQISRLRINLYTLCLQADGSVQFANNSHRSPAFEAPELPRVLPTNSRRTWLHVHMFSLGVTVFHMADYALPEMTEPQLTASLLDLITDMSEDNPKARLPVESVRRAVREHRMQPHVGRYSEAVRQLVNSVLSMPATSPATSLTLPNGHHRSMPISLSQSPPKSTPINGKFVAASPAPSSHHGSNSSSRRGSTVGSEQSAYDEGLERRRKQQEAHILATAQRAIRIRMLDDTYIVRSVNTEVFVKDLLRYVTGQLSLRETAYFGLATLREDEIVFLAMDSRVVDYFPSLKRRNSGRRDSGGRRSYVASNQSAQVLDVDFRVEFYVENASVLAFEDTRHLYYLQLKRDVVSGALPTSDVHAVQLTSYALQAEFGDYSPQVHAGRYFSLYDVFPESTVAHMTAAVLEQKMPEQHRKFSGMTRIRAETEYLKLAQKLQEYGVLFYSVTGVRYRKKVPLRLGICTRGVRIYDDVPASSHKGARYAWKNLRELELKKKKVKIYVNTPEGVTKHSLTCSSSEKAAYLHQRCKAYHKFHLMVTERYGQITSTPANPVGSQRRPTLDPNIEVDNTIRSVSDHGKKRRPMSAASSLDSSQASTVASKSRTSTASRSRQTPSDLDGGARRPQARDPTYPPPAMMENVHVAWSLDMSTDLQTSPEPSMGATTPLDLQADESATSAQINEDSAAESEPVVVVATAPITQPSAPRTQEQQRAAQRALDRALGQPTPRDVPANPVAETVPLDAAPRAAPRDIEGAVVQPQTEVEVKPAKLPSLVQEPDRVATQAKRTLTATTSVGDSDDAADEAHKLPAVAEKQASLDESMNESEQDEPSSPRGRRRTASTRPGEARHPTQPFTVILDKQGARTLGLSVAGQGDVRLVQPNGPADADGRIKRRDRILAVDGRKLEGLEHEDIVQVLRDTSDRVTLKIQPRPLRLKKRPKNQTNEPEPTQVTPENSRGNKVKELPPPAEGMRRVELAKSTKSGLGFTIASKRRDPAARVLVGKIHAGSPAETAGLEIGDQIVAVDGQSLERLNATQALQLLSNTRSVTVLDIKPTAPSRRQSQLSLMTSPRSTLSNSGSASEQASAKPRLDSVSEGSNANGKPAQATAAVTAEASDRVPRATTPSLPTEPVASASATEKPTRTLPAAVKRVPSGQTRKLPMAPHLAHRQLSSGSASSSPAAGSPVVGKKRILPSPKRTPSSPRNTVKAKSVDIPLDPTAGLTATTGPLRPLTLTRGAKGLGMVISGGIDHQLGAIFVHKLNPSGPAAMAGLQPGDRLLSVNETPLSGLSHRQALQVLKEADSPLQIKTQRVVPEQWHKLMDHALALHRSTPLTTPEESIPSNLSVPSGCKLVQLTKSTRGFGFSIQGGKNRTPPEPISVRKLISNGPADKDGRMQIGDVVLVANNKSLADATFDEALTTLKGLPATATFCLLPKDMQTNVAPTEEPKQRSAAPKEPEAVTPHDNVASSDKPEAAKPSDDAAMHHQPASNDASAAQSEPAAATPNYYTPLVGDALKLKIKSNNTFGFAMSGGVDSQRPLFVKKVTPMMPAALAGVAKYDAVTTINGVDVTSMTLSDALTVVKAAKGQLDLALLRPDLPSRQLMKRAKDGPSRQSSVSSTASDIARPVATKVAPKVAQPVGPERRNSLDEHKFLERLERSDAPGVFLRPTAEEPTPTTADYICQQPFAHTKRYTVVIEKGSRTLGLKFKGTRLPNQGASLKVQQVMPGGAAAEDGRIQPGDVLMGLDDKEVYGQPEKEVYASLRATTGKVKMQFARDGQAATEDLKPVEPVEPIKPSKGLQPTAPTSEAAEPTKPLQGLQPTPPTSEAADSPTLETSEPRQDAVPEDRLPSIAPAANGFAEGVTQDQEEEEDMDGDLPDLPVTTPPVLTTPPAPTRPVIQPETPSSPTPEIVSAPAEAKSEPDVDIAVEVLPIPETEPTPTAAREPVSEPSASVRAESPPTVVEASSPLNLDVDSISLAPDDDVVSLAPDLPTTLPPSTPALDDDDDDDELDLDDLDDLDLGDDDAPSSPTTRPQAKSYTKISPSRSMPTASVSTPAAVPQEDPLDQSLITSSAAIANEDVYDHVRSRRVSQLPREDFDATQKRKWKQIRQAVQGCMEEGVPASEYGELKKMEYEGTVAVGGKPEHRKLNRYKDVLPFDAHRVMLGADGYINASHLELPVAPSVVQQAIMAQGPLKDTCQHFWQMVFEQEVNVVIMVTAEVERGKVKCHSYWPPRRKKKFTFGNFTIENLHVKRNPDFVASSLLLTESSSGKARNVYHFRYVGWPDHGVPSDTSGVLNMLKEAYIFQGTHDTPMVIHCSAGIGRSGVFASLHCLHMALRQPIRALEVVAQEHYDYDSISVKDIVRQLRLFRHRSVVQTQDQYVFIYQAYIELLNDLERR
eukprot:m.283658 g.283658  ORF g.283658 m.283658 type:complete len:2430 (-) comp17761_c0_seq9:2565-9854(-)